MTSVCPFVAGEVCRQTFLFHLVEAVSIIVTRGTWNGGDGDCIWQSLKRTRLSRLLTTRKVHVTDVSYVPSLCLRNLMSRFISLRWLNNWFCWRMDDDVLVAIYSTPFMRGVNVLDKVWCRFTWVLSIVWHASSVKLGHSRHDWYGLLTSCPSRRFRCPCFFLVFERANSSAAIIALVCTINY